MVTKRFCTLLSLLFFIKIIYSAPAVDISGTIQNLAEEPIENATITLSGKSFNTTSDNAGYFEIVLEETPINQVSLSPVNHPQFKGTRFYFNNPNNEKAQITFYDLSGVRLFSKQLSSLNQENFVDLKDELSHNSYTMGIFVYKIGSTQFIYKAILSKDKISITSTKMGGTSTVSSHFSRAYQNQIVDTLKVYVEDDLKFLMPLTSYFEGSLIITLDILPELYTAKVNETPDYYQLDNAYGGFHNGGQVFCGPTTISNSLMWLSNNGYPKLAGNYNDEKYAQFKMIETLGSDSYMGLGSGGVGPSGICYGVNKYFNTKGVNYKSMKYQGWRSVASAYSTGVKTPSMEWLKKGLMGKGSVWLNYGWYNYNSNTNTYTRNGGHWMTLVGFGWDGDSKEPNCLIVHDPWTGNTFNNFRNMSKINSGKLDGSNTGLPRNAAGYYKYWTGSKYGILDGVVVLTME